MPTLALFAGDSLTAKTYINAQGSTVPSGIYADLLCYWMGTTRVGATGTNAAAKPGAALSNAFTSYTYQSFNGIDNFDASVGAYAPDLLFLLWGANDAELLGSNGTDLDTWDRAWTAYWVKINALPKRPYTYVLGLPCTPAPLTSPPFYSYNPRWFRREMDGITQQHARTQGGEFIALDTVTDPGMSRDGIHLTTRGHFAVAGAILDFWGVL